MNVIQAYKVGMYGLTYKFITPKGEIQKEEAYQNELDYGNGKLLLYNYLCYIKTQFRAHKTIYFVHLLNATCSS